MLTIFHIWGRHGIDGSVDEWYKHAVGYSWTT